MASAAPPTDDIAECPVCHDGFKEPKILPCTHRVCGQCVLSWLQNEGGQAGCPLCREPILSSTHQGQDDLATQVNALPTDLVIEALMKSQKILQGRHICKVCDDDVTATSYCLQCDIKLCKSCTKTHKKYPSFRDHITEDLSQLTAQRLVASRRSSCNNHSDRPAELYCQTHQELMCFLCATTIHEGCSGKKTITDMAKVARAELTQRVQRLRDMDSSLAQQINQTKEEFKVVYRKVKDVFDDLQQALDERRNEVNTKIKKDEDTAVTSLAAMEKHRTALKSHSTSVEQLVVTSPDEALLEMMKNLMSQLDDLESQTKVKAADEMTFELQALTCLKTDIGNLGHVSHDGEATSTKGDCCPTCGQKSQPVLAIPTTPTTTTTVNTTKTAAVNPTGAELARILKVGYRVRRGSGWPNDYHGDVDGTPPGPGTVVKIGKGEITGQVRVRWDTGSEVWHCMGGGGFYELELL